MPCRTSEVRRCACACCMRACSCVSFYVGRVWCCRPRGWAAERGAQERCQRGRRRERSRRPVVEGRKECSRSMLREVTVRFRCVQRSRCRRWLLVVLFVLARYILYRERVFVFILIVFYRRRLGERAVRYRRQGTCSWPGCGAWRGCHSVVIATLPIE